MQQEKWFNRSFNFTSNQQVFPAVMERLWGTPARLEEKLRNAPENILTLTANNTWSIKENIGHLTDLEPLWQGRLQDILNGAELLRPTDLQNTQTQLANHNATPLPALLAAFRSVRQQTMQALATIDEATVFKHALHPRLLTPMRTIDLFVFVAEHDDHHLARITELLGGSR